MIFNELSFINKYKFSNSNDVEIFIKECQDKLVPLKGERENLHRMLRKEIIETNKTIIQTKIDLLTEKINDLQSKIRIGKRCIGRIEKLRVQNIDIERRIRDFHKEKNKSKNDRRTR